MNNFIYYLIVSCVHVFHGLTLFFILYCNFICVLSVVIIKTDDDDDDDVHVFPVFTFFNLQLLNTTASLGQLR